MSICVELHLEGRSVAIIGGGKVAARKCRHFLENGACVTVTAPYICEEIKESGAVCREEAFAFELPEAVSLVYAATDDPVLNHEIVEYCGRRGILCGSAQKDTDVSFSSMTSKSYGQAAVAATTRGLSPVLGREIAAECARYVQACYGRRLDLLSCIRERIGEDTYRSLRGGLSLWKEEKLEIVAEIAEADRVRVEVLHGCSDRKLLEEELPRFMNERKAEGEYALYCFSSAHIYEKCRETYPGLFSLDEILFLAQKLGQTAFSFEPLFVGQGVCCERVMDKCASAGDVLPVCPGERLLGEWVKQEIGEHPDQVCLFVSHEKFPWLKNLCAECGAAAMGMREEIPELTKKRVLLVPLFIGRGRHFEKDVLAGEGSLAERLRQMGYEVSADSRSLISRFHKM